MTPLLGIVIFGVYSAALLAIGAVGFTLQFGVTNVLNLAFGSILTACIFAEYGLTGHSTNLWIAMAVGVEKVKDSGYQGLNGFPIPNDGTQRTLTAAAMFSMVAPAYARRYGVSDEEMRAIAVWLESQK